MDITPVLLEIKKIINIDKWKETNETEINTKESQQALKKISDWVIFGDFDVALEELDSFCPTSHDNKMNSSCTSSYAKLLIAEMINIDNVFHDEKIKTYLAAKELNAESKLDTITINVSIFVSFSKLISRVDKLLNECKET